MAVEISQLEAKVAQLVGEGITRAASGMQADLAAQKLENARRADEITKLDAEIAHLKTAASANTVTMDGPAASIAREYGKGDDLALFPVSRSYTIGGKAHTEISDGLLTSSRTFGDAHLEVKTLWEAGLVALACKGKNASNMSSGELRRAFMEHNGAIVAKIADRVVRMGLASDRDTVVSRVFGVSAGNGSDLIPGEVLAPEMLRVASAAIMDSPVGLLVQKTIDARNMKSPLGTARPRPYLQGSASASAAADYVLSAMGTDVLAYTVKNMACAVQYDRNAEADAIIAFMPELRTQMAEAMALALFDAVLNGDTASTHQDSLSAWAPEGVFPVATPSGGTMVGSALDHRRAFLGLRARAFDIGSGAKADLASSYTFAKIQGMQAKMSGGVGQNNARVAIFASFENILNRFSTLAEVLTLEKFGPAATILTGQVLSLGGKPVIRSWPLGRTGAETGAFGTDGLHSATAGNNTKQSIVMADLDRYILGTRQGLRVESDVNITNGTGVLVASGRYALESPDHAAALTSASTVNVVVGYDAS
jgi:hypothetical protein